MSYASTAYENKMRFSEEFWGRNDSTHEYEKGTKNGKMWSTTMAKQKQLIEMK